MEGKENPDKPEQEGNDDSSSLPLLEELRSPPASLASEKASEASTERGTDATSSSSKKEARNKKEAVEKDGVAAVGKPLARLPGSVSGHDGIFGRSPFTCNPPHPEERRPRIACPRTPREYIINFREDLADFQESHGLPRTRDYSFVSLGLALAQETVRAIYSVILVLAELFPILAIISLILRFALDKLIEILETQDSVTKVRKTVIFVLEMLVIIVPLWIFIGTIVMPLLSLIFSVFKRLLQFKGGKKKSQSKTRFKGKPLPCPSKPGPAKPSIG